MKVLSLFDGMACGMLAMRSANIRVDRYVAFEIDKYAIQSAKHNFPMIEEMGDVFKADFSQYKGFDWLIGGSPCTYWSIAQSSDKRETTASGMGWELFSQYVRALHEVKPKFFIYENNKSMSKAIRDSIRNTFGFEEICINSALVSAQNRQRFYWVGRLNEHGYYSKVDVQQPADRGIYLKDVLDSAIAWRDKSNTIDACYFHGGNLSNLNKQSGQRFYAAEPVPGDCHRIGTFPGAKHPEQDSKQYRIYTADGKSTTLCGEGGGLGAKTGLYAVPVNTTMDGKSQTVKAQGAKTSIANICCYSSTYGASGVAEPVNMTSEGKAGTLRATCYKDGIRNIVGNDVDRKTGVAEPVDGDWGGSAKYLLKNLRTEDQKTVTLTACSYKGVGADGMTTVAIPVPTAVDLQVVGRKRNEEGEWERSWEAHTDGKGSAITSVESRRMVAEPCDHLFCCCNGEKLEVREATKSGVAVIEQGECVDVAQPNSKTRRGRRMSEKSNCLTTSPDIFQYCGVLAYATPCEWDENGTPIKAISGADRKVYTVYEVSQGNITIKGKQYPIKLIDGYYIIRKLTVTECKRLQTVPEWYEFPVSDTQAYRQLGNGWTVEVIAHLITACVNERPADRKACEQISLFNKNQGEGLRL